jgi:hypothetical protein
MRRSMSALVLAGLMALSLGIGSALAAPAARSTENVTWLYDPSTPIGTSSLVRTDAGLSATFRSSGVPAGQAVTLWFIVFNNPSACAATCGLADLLFNLDAQGDFLVGGGNVVGGSGLVTIGGNLKVGDTTGSGFPEIGFDPERAIGLTNPWGAQVSLLLHSHGPMVPGPTLASQISSFTGGCTTFLGDLELPGSGLADGPEDVPNAVGECSTLQGSVHLP